MRSDFSLDKGHLMFLHQKRLKVYDLWTSISSTKTQHNGGFLLDIILLTGGCSEGLDAFRFFFKNPDRETYF